MLYIADWVAHLIFKILNINYLVLVYFYLTFPVSCNRGLAILAKFLIHLLVISTIPRKARTPVWSIGVGY
jgi:hypothetical protein